MTDATMTLHDYRTGEALRTLTADEAARYVAEIATDTTHTGAVDGEPYGYAGRTVYAVE